MISRLVKNRPKPRLLVRSIAQIAEANVQFGDLTVLVGPQATGKSVFLQLLKLVLDTGAVTREMRSQGLDWDNDVERFLDLYLGEGMGRSWRSDRSSIEHDGELFQLSSTALDFKESKSKDVFLIPAQRVLAIREGWPRAFDLYSQSDPYCVRAFSERLRRWLDGGYRTGSRVFPNPEALEPSLLKMISREVFRGLTLRVDTTSQKRLILRSNKKGVGPLPQMTWSAGQREFVPLLLGLLSLPDMDSTAMQPDRGPRRWVLIEEPEMGLHPRAISSVLLLVLRLLARGFRVCVSTHSTEVLDLVWAVGRLRTGVEAGAVSRSEASRWLLHLFGLGKANGLDEILCRALDASTRVYCFDRDSGKTLDISTLDPGSEEAVISEWGGLSGFAGRAGELVSRVVQRMESGSSSPRTGR